ncbi:MAG: bifunctional folylpolyglutamate synthase/dihydrofolate synthase [Candidatus Gastranaerophilales bacterium]|nr:bifunctional folylpolyglutamate synthase/dihydrofolate synthase [Candidatus Gastranaerophilales bacterium]
MKKALEILKSHEKFHITLGLERIEKILKILGNPQNSYKVIHVAGTNGKGSTCKIINQILIEAGYKTGLYTSPHIFEYEERITVNNEKISNYIFDKLINEVDELAKKNNIELSEFELLTAVGFYYFYIKQVDYAVIETGLGGLYDATNVIKKPDSTVITSIDFDHTERLGNTIEEIASQKAGIIKANTHVAVSSDNKGFEKIKEKTEELKAKLIEIPDVTVEFNNGRNIARINKKEYEFNLLGAHQAQNLALALGALKHLKIKQEIIKKALKNVSWPYRLEYDPENNILIDSSHNPSGIQSLRNFLDENFKDIKKTFFFGCLKNKDYKNMLKILKHKEDKLYFIEFDYPNALKFEESDKEFEAEKYNFNSLNEIKNMEGLKVICGSIYMLGNILKQN